jgi:UDP-N-acetylmuramoylalanine--D-glutamate ligase
MVSTHRDNFAGKHVTVMGLGLLGRGVNDARFLAENGALLTITDLKSAAELAPSLEALAAYPRITYVLGEHRLDDFRTADFVLKAAGVPLDSPFVAEARRHGVPVEMDEALFAKLSGATVAGVTGTRGKTTTALLLHTILERAGCRPRLGGNIRDIATLPLLDEVRAGDIAVLELSSWQLQGFGEAELSPHVSVFTNFMPDHMTYYGGDMGRYFADKAHIYRHQSEADVLVVGPDVAGLIPRRELRGRLVVADASEVPGEWRLPMPGEHNRANVALAAAAARALGASESDIRGAVESFAGVPERLELVREVGGIAYVDDTTSTIPEATIAALDALAGREIVLIGGGVDKGLDYGDLADVIARRTKAAVLFEGTATDKLLGRLAGRRAHVTTAAGMREAFERATGIAAAGDVVLLSPGAASFGIFRNEFDRGEQFVELVRGLSDS